MIAGWYKISLVVGSLTFEFVNEWYELFKYKEFSWSTLHLILFELEREDIYFGKVVNISVGLLGFRIDIVIPYNIDEKRYEEVLESVKKAEKLDDKMEELWDNPEDEAWEVIK